MFPQVEQLIYIYIAVCLAMIAFDGVFAVSRKMSFRNIERKKKKCKEAISIQLERCREHQAISPQIQEDLAKWLKRQYNLMAFHWAITQMQKEEPELTQQYLCQCRSLFLGLGTACRSQNDLHKAYFAYLMWQYKIEKDQAHSALAELLIEFATSQNIYCRENALQALYSFGQAENVATAILRLSNAGIRHHEKLLVDGLAGFNGDHTQLIQELWKRYPELDVPYQIAFVGYVRLVSGSCKADFAKLLQDPLTDQEVKLSLLRYFRKYPYQPVYRQLLEYLWHYRNYAWEYAAIAALALQSYPGKETVEALKFALSSNNWYIRQNAAESLTALGVSYLDVVDIYNGDDRFAREMLDFQMRERERKGGEAV